MAESRAARVAVDVSDSAYAWTKWVAHTLRPRDGVSLASGHRGPVLLLPGVYETWQFLLPVGERLHALGHPVHVPVDFGFNLRSIPESAALAQSLIEERDLNDVTVVAHSKGGLIAKQMMVTEDIVLGRISRLIAINTPFGGSSHARFALRRALREFSPTAPTITTLQREILVNARIISIFSERDPVIPDGSWLSGAENIQIPVAGHFRILSSPLLFTAIERVIGSSTAT